jgi:hypothetical protein
VRNFYRAAEKGLAAEMIWPSTKQNEPQYRRIDDILNSFLPLVGDKLEQGGFLSSDYKPLCLHHRSAAGRGERERECGEQPRRTGDPVSHDENLAPTAVVRQL